MSEFEPPPLPEAACVFPRSFSYPPVSCGGSSFQSSTFFAPIPDADGYIAANYSFAIVQQNNASEICEKVVIDQLIYSPFSCDSEYYRGVDVFDERIHHKSYEEDQFEIRFVDNSNPSNIYIPDIREIEMHFPTVLTSKGFEPRDLFRNSGIGLLPNLEKLTIVDPNNRWFGDTITNVLAGVNSSRKRNNGGFTLTALNISASPNLYCCQEILFPYPSRDFIPYTCNELVTIDSTLENPFIKGFCFCGDATTQETCSLEYCDGFYFDSTTNACIRCEAGYECSSGEKRPCPSGTFSLPESPICESCSNELCKGDCDPTTGSCNSCVKGYARSVIGTCVEQYCDFNTYVNSDTTGNGTVMNDTISLDDGTLLSVPHFEIPDLYVFSKPEYRIDCPMGYYGDIVAVCIVNNVIQINNTSPTITRRGSSGKRSRKESSPQDDEDDSDDDEDENDTVQSTNTFTTLKNPYVSSSSPYGISNVFQLCSTCPPMPGCELVRCTNRTNISCFQCRQGYRFVDTTPSAVSSPSSSSVQSEPSSTSTMTLSVALVLITGYCERCIDNLKPHCVLGECEKEMTGNLSEIPLLLVDFPIIASSTTSITAASPSPSTIEKVRQTCLECEDRFYLDEVSNDCLPCSELCQQCSNVMNNCTLCPTASFLTAMDEMGSRTCVSRTSTNVLSTGQIIGIVFGSIIGLTLLLCLSGFLLRRWWIKRNEVEIMKNAGATKLSAGGFQLYTDEEYNQQIETDRVNSLSTSREPQSQ